MIGADCLLHVHREPVVIEAVPIWPAARGGPTGGPTVPICANSAGLVWDLLDRIEEHAATRALYTARLVLADPPERWRQAIPGPERLVAYKIWLSYGDAFLRGSLAAYVEAWRPDGSPRVRGFPHHDDYRPPDQAPARHRRRITR